MNKKWIHAGLFSLFLLAVFLSRCTGKFFLQPDSFTYMATAHAMLEGKWYLEMWGRVPLGVPPLYPMLIAVGESWVGLEAEKVAFLISVLSSCLLIPLVFLWAARRLGWTWSWVATLLVAFNVALVFYGLTLLTESLFTLLFFSAVGLSWVSLRRIGHPLLWLGTGGIMGLSILTKGSGWILPAVVLCWIGFQGIWGRYLTRKTLYGVVALLFGVLMITQPAAWLSRIPEGGGALSGETSLVSQLLKPDLRDLMERERYLGVLTPSGDQFQVEVNQERTLTEVLRAQGMAVIKLVAVNTGLAIKSLPLLIPWWILVWIPAGVVLQWMTRNHEGLSFSGYLLMVSLGLMGFYALAGAYTSAIGPERYAIPLIPLLILWAVIGLREVYLATSRIWNIHGVEFKFFGFGVVLFLLSLVLLPALSHGKKILFLPKDQRLGTSESEMLGKWILRNLGPGRKIMIRNPAIPYYADGLWVLTPFEPIDRVIRYAQGQGVHLMIVRGDVEEVLRPQLAPLLGKDYRHPGLRRVLGVPNRRDPSRLESAVYVFQ